jgi:hypothetical protein
VGVVVHRHARHVDRAILEDAVGVAEVVRVDPRHAQDPVVRVLVVVDAVADAERDVAAARDAGVRLHVEVVERPRARGRRQEQRREAEESEPRRYFL